MRIKCSDGVVREFIPAQQPSNQHTIEAKKAYCFHCEEQFTTQESIHQKEIWRAHSCKSGSKRKTS